ncbi:hypothetical protein QVO32_05850 [Bacteroides gallinaceum]|uniref:hypothetical protein n=1 Tax=Bacteroides gallinaceum TaxID=1462571 RepID=UPI0025AA6087|nr:hypothetical protein [Bacteroides gallinaceum]MDN0078935.1 hypothetical protein [Bacteroides gallinaceum]
MHCFIVSDTKRVKRPLPAPCILLFSRLCLSPPTGYISRQSRLVFIFHGLERTFQPMEYTFQPVEYTFRLAEYKTYLTA